MHAWLYRMYQRAGKTTGVLNRIVCPAEAVCVTKNDEYIQYYFLPASDGRVGGRGGGELSFPANPTRTVVTQSKRKIKHCNELAVAG